ncbi:MAG: nuclear transport factor 2 family protein [Ilumatobacteraceae bacterium]
MTAEAAFLDRVRRLHFEYCTYVDNADFVGLRSLFAPSAVIDYGPTMRACGVDAIDRLFRGLRNSCEATSHHATNIVADLGSMAGTAYVMAWHKFTEDPDLVVWGRYVDDYVSIDGEVRVAQRTLMVHGATRPMPFNTLPRTSP